jgi:hypothetical protein
VPSSLWVAPPSCCTHLSARPSKEVATWQSQEWPPGRCAAPRARRTVAPRRTLLFTYFSQVPRPVHIAGRAPSHPPGAAFAWSSRKMCRSADAPGSGVAYRGTGGRSITSPQGASGHRITRPRQLTYAPGAAFALPRSYALSPDEGTKSGTSTCACTRSHNTPRAYRPFAGGPGPMGPARGGHSRGRELRLYGVLGSSA